MARARGADAAGAAPPARPRAGPPAAGDARPRAHLPARRREPAARVRAGAGHARRRRAALDALQRAGRRRGRSALPALLRLDARGRRDAGAAAVPQRPALFAAAEEVWWALGRKDWLEAFAAHPRIGDKKTGGGARPRSRPRWSRTSRPGARRRRRGRSAALAAAQRAYYEKFGFIYIVFATGKTRPRDAGPAAGPPAGARGRARGRRRGAARRSPACACTSWCRSERDHHPCPRHCPRPSERAASWDQQLLTAASRPRQLRGARPGSDRCRRAAADPFCGGGRRSPPGCTA